MFPSDLGFPVVGRDTPDHAPTPLLGRVGNSAQDDIDETLRLLRAMQSAPHPQALIRAYRPGPTMAFSRRESLMPEFAAASSAARELGFDPVIRLAGGRAVAYDETCLVIDLIAPSHLFADPLAAFDATAASFCDLLRGLGIDARVGAVEGEYCSGAHSVNARGQVKLVGIAQRTMRQARLLTAAIVMESPQRLVPVIDAVYGAMGLKWSPATLGGLRDEGARLSLDDIVNKLVAGLAGQHSAWSRPGLSRTVSRSSSELAR